MTDKRTSATNSGTILTPANRPSAPKNLSAEEARAERRYQSQNWGQPIGTFAEEFPKTHRLLTAGHNAKKIRWPIPPRCDDLKRLLSHYFESKDQAPEGLLFQFLNRALVAESKPSWTVKAFREVLERVYEEREAYDLEHPAPARAGRKPTALTARVERIRAALRCTRARAYAVARDGTSDFESRQILAAEFAEDREWNYPAAWELKFGQTRAGRPWGVTFRNYVESGTDDFEGLAALSRVKAEYRKGTLPDNFKDGHSFVKALDRQGAHVADAIHLWDAFIRWKKAKLIERSE